MIKKHREKSNRMLIHEAGLRRLLPSHPQYQLIEQEYGKMKYGYKGEEALDYYLTFLPHENYHILHGLRIEDPKGRYFQMDTLLITSTHCLVIDSKYVSGKLEFDEVGCQLIRHKADGEMERMADPLSQVARQRFQLSLWLEHQGFPSLPIASLVALTHNKAHLVKTSPSLMKKVTFLTNLPNRVNEINALHSTEVLNKKDLNKLTKTLIKKHTHDSFNFLQTYNIKQEELIKGVICMDCGSNLMKKIRKYWTCKKCNTQSLSAHLYAIEDYKVLIATTIQNKDLKDFLLLSSASEAYNILASLDLPSVGHKKGRSYSLEHFKTSLTP
ncbi:nuclease-related domain-containing protein [Bacillus sp. RO1]|uniref:nuclease-related domain-containing protein n=1 Tax=Bacillus sp. RO1 TaxID=2722703 RepID=UPI00145687BF|nr:nuclease-related domain-containing protein [Bacillus sp. RO1]NLP51971.1 NERD domain-containing protein [Bacillus sp. RO1]